MKPSLEDNAKNSREDNDDDYKEEKKEGMIDKQDRTEFKPDVDKTSDGVQEKEDERNENGGEGEEEEEFTEQDIVDELFICVPSKFMSEQV